jgi:hypothetical protein
VAFAVAGVGAGVEGVLVLVTTTPLGGVGKVLSIL